MLTIQNLHVRIGEKEILRGIDLTVKAGEIHAIMGPNGSGKSTLSQVIAGREDLVVSQGSLVFEQENLLELSVEERARRGIFVAFQYPVAVPGLNNLQFMREAVNAQRRFRGEKELSSSDFLKKAQKVMHDLGIPQEFSKRSLNDGFSGGEKKKNEILQMYLLEPKLIILDEIDSGLDIDALQMVARSVNSFHNEKRAFLLVTHYQRLLHYIEPNYVHVLVDGKIVESGGKELAEKLEKHGYDIYKNQLSS
ncbi:MAG: Fe-S cluster assembly ATPase SufC [Leptospiraceae bacterium]|nr:Fe-S cluster assembly ATPase SufC [Leptospiraceae bacterium]MDW8306453.1 Fe-S cluster assembly ATPase SufC [Leptospiraceae bacterium]